MADTYEIRLINTGDIAGALAVYTPFVLNTAITFEYYVPTLDEFTTKVETITNGYPWLVYLHNGKVKGYAYGSIHRSKTAYQWSPESTIYLSSEAQGNGIGRILYETLFSLMRLQGYINVFAGVSLPNEQSESFQKSLGFEEIGVFKNIGYKLGKWHDTRWFQLHLAGHFDEPGQLKTITEIENEPAFQKILVEANEKLNAKHTL